MIKNFELIPPIAKKIPHELEKHGDLRIDNYFWMKDRELTKSRYLRG
jgi:oligopeptidase B